MITVRIARIEDAQAIAELAAELGYPATPAVMLARLQKILGRDDQLAVVAEESDGKLCGWLQAHAHDVIVSGFRAQLSGLVVAGNHRRKGVGRLLVNRAEQWATQIGAGAILVQSNVQRTESHAFYPALGYKLAKTQAVYRKSLPRLPPPKAD